MERVVNEWDVIIKVKYGDTLRRFGAHVNGNSVDPDMNLLRVKILALFNLGPVADISLSYTDVDGDLVTLVDNSELLDAVINQRLNPLRINVKLNGNPAISNKSFNSESPSRNSSPFSAEPSHVNTAIAEALKAVPNPLGAVLSKLSQDFLSTAAASAPGLAEFIEHFTKLGLSHASQGHAPASHQGDLNSNSSGTPGDLLSGATVAPNTISVDHALKNKEKLPETVVKAEQQKENAATYTNESAINTRRAPLSLIDEMQNFEMTGHSLTSANTSRETASDQTNINVIGNMPSMPFQSSFTENGFVTGRNFGSSNPAVSSATSFNPLECPYRRSRSYNDSSLPVFHRGVSCDGCGMYPITGPRYKSNVKENYDLCSICFSQMGNEADYSRMDRPQHRSPQFFRESFGRNSFSHGFRGHGMGHFRAKLESRFIQDVTILDGTLMPPSTPFTKIWKMHNNGSIPWPVGTQLVWIGGDQFADTSSIELEIPMNGFPTGAEIDIAVDFIAPSRLGRYISYWRLSVPTGQKFGQRVWVLIQVDAKSTGNGFPVEFNLNLPTASGGLNGVRLIDINAEPLEEPNYSQQDLSGLYVEDNKLLPDGIPGKSFQSVPINGPDMAHNGSTEVVPDMSPKVSYPTVDPSPVSLIDTRGKAPMLSYPPVIDTNLSSYTAPPNMVTSPPYPSTNLPPPSATAPKISIVSAPKESTPPKDPHKESTAEQAEEALLKDLDEMGFKQIDLNKEILRMNDYDLEQSLSDLCGDVGDQDPLLKELQEMGFTDMKLNKKLLIKNGGSIKRVVLDLIAGEK